MDQYWTDRRFAGVRRGAYIVEAHSDTTDSECKGGGDKEPAGHLRGVLAVMQRAEGGNNAR